MNTEEEMDPLNKPVGVSPSASGSASDRNSREQEQEEEERKKKKKAENQFPINGTEVQRSDWIKSLESTGWSKDKDNNYCQPGETEPTFGIEEMPGGRQALVFKKKDPESIKAVIATMKDKGVALAFIGPENNPHFDRDLATRIYLEAQKQKVNISGWTPDQKDIDKVMEAEQSQVQRQELTLTAQDLKDKYAEALGGSKGDSRMTDAQASKHFQTFKKEYTAGNLGNDQGKALETFTAPFIDKYKNTKLPTTATVQPPKSNGRSNSR